MTRLCGSNIAFDPKHIERRKSIATVVKKLSYLLVVFGFACRMAGQLDLELKPPNVDHDFPLPLFLFQVQNPGEVMPHFLFCLPVVTDGHSMYYKGISLNFIGNLIFIRGFLKSDPHRPKSRRQRSQEKRSNSKGK